MAAPSDCETTHESKQSNFHPGAAPYGNFINYYSFNPPLRRLQFIPKDLLSRILDGRIQNHDATATTSVSVLDVGCNTGDLTIALYQHLINSVVPKNAPSKDTCEETSKEQLPKEQHQPVKDDSSFYKTCSTEKPNHCQYVSQQNSPETSSCEGNSQSVKLLMLGCDIDKVLIQRATAANPYPDNVAFQELDIMVEANSNRLFTNFLETHHAPGLFDLTTCFSVTMWIHLHQGDQGLLTFLKQVSKQTRYLIIEPQPWKCYKSAVRRVKKLGQSMQWQSLNELEFREDVVKQIEKHLVMECNMEVVQRLGETEWERQLLLLRNTLHTKLT